LVGILVIVWAILDRKATFYTLTTRRIHVKRGIVGKNSSEVLLADVRNVTVNYRVEERIFGIGSVGVASAGTAGVELRLAGVVGPDAVRNQIVGAIEATRE